MDTSSRILEAAVTQFGTSGFDATSLDDLARSLDIRKQTILYHFGSKDDLLRATVDHAGAEMVDEIEQACAGQRGWEAVDAVVGVVFRVAVRQPAKLGLLREVMRLGAPWATQLTDGFDPLIKRACEFLETEMDAGRMRRSDSRLVLVSAYSTVVGVATEIEVLRAVGIEPTLREAVRRRSELRRFLRAALC